MKHTFKTLLAIAALLVPAFLLAQSAGDTDADANKILAAADKHLNAAYQSLIKSIHDDGGPNADLDLQSLRDSQRAWLKYRDAQVAFVGTHADVGSSSARAAGMATYSVQLTNERIKDLKDVPNPF
jgi:uncharacterized protein YecT (DUF1311 family)